MKKTFVTLLAILSVSPVFFSCTEKEEMTTNQETGYTYHFEIDEADTRATLTDDGVFWESGDRVGLFTGGVNSVAANVNVSTTPKTIDFTSASPLEEGTTIRAYYPFRENNTEVSAVKIEFPSYQKGGTVSAMPMAGVPTVFHEGATNGAIRFMNLGSVLDFRVFSSSLYTGEQIQSITFMAAPGSSVSGTALVDLVTVSWDEEGPRVHELDWSDGRNFATLTPDNATVAASKDAAAADHLYLVVAPGTYSGSISVVTDAATYSFPISGVTCKRNGLKRVNLDLEKETAMRGGVYSIENDKVKTYLDAVYADPYNPDDYSYTHMKNSYYQGNTTNRYDWPKHVPVSWSDPSSGNGTKVVYVYNDMAMNDLELSVSVSSTSANSADVYNLIPGRTYYYKVTNGQNAEPVASGTFATTGRRRMLKVGGDYGQGYANNCRDFGGQVTQDGRRIKYGKLFRGSNVDLIFPSNDRNGNNHPEAKGVLKDYLKIGLDVDLRNSTTHSSYIGKGNNYLYDALQLGEWHTTKSFNSWGDFHDRFSDGYKMTTILTQVFEAVAADKTVYIHCMVGADRTGYVCMLLEAILGVGQGWCDVDYELTSFSGAVDGGRARYRVGNYGNNNSESVNYYYRTKDGELRGVDFIRSLSDAEYGTTFNEKVVNYVVKDLGVSMNDIVAFRNNMLEN